MTIRRIERIVDGRVVGTAERSADDGRYHCHFFGSNTDPKKFSSLDEVADFLRTNSGAGVRMNPGWGKISRNLFIDGKPL
jgi:hypothetical protein